MLEHPRKGLALPLCPISIVIGLAASCILPGLAGEGEGQGCPLSVAGFYDLICREGIPMKKMKSCDQYEGQVTWSGYTGSLPYWSTSELGPDLGSRSHRGVRTDVSIGL